MRRPTIISRRQVMQFGLAAGLGVLLTGLGSATPSLPVVRPPRALPGRDFSARCMRCGVCVQACPSRALEQRDLSPDLTGIGTPYLRARQGGCAAWNDGCRRCAEVCPSGALNPNLPLTGIGIARFRPSECTNCMACLRRCPVPGAVVFPDPQRGLGWNRDEEHLIPYEMKLVTSPIKPVINEEICVGCGLCAAHCIPKIMWLEPN